MYLFGPQEPRSFASGVFGPSSGQAAGGTNEVPLICSRTAANETKSFRPKPPNLYLLTSPLPPTPYSELLWLRDNTDRGEYE
jgi:hypothetical protein